MSEWKHFAAIAISTVTVATVGGAESLYQTESYQGIVSDVVAHKPGDTITVLVLEESRGSASATADTERTTSAAAHADGEISGVGGGTAEGSVDLTHEFAGEGSITRAGRLIAQVSVRVVEALPSGNLVINGERELVFNQEIQSIKVTGEVRPYDIAPDNTVLSTRLSNASIEYTGDGILARAEAESWLNFLLDLLF